MVKNHYITITKQKSRANASKFWCVCPNKNRLYVSKNLHSRRWRTLSLVAEVCL